jgi:RNA polymerase sigma-70 factor (ECF subfamily)
LDLLERAKAGDSMALDALIGRYLPRLRRWAKGRLPGWARDLADTQDLVQETVTQAFKRIDQFEPRGEGALQAYLRQALINRIRSEIRRVGRRPQSDELDSQAEAPGPSPLERVIGREAVERYERALARLRPADREAIVGRVEMGMTNEELADALGKHTPNAARMAVERALFRLAKEMRHPGNGSEA